MNSFPFCWFDFADRSSHAFGSVFNIETITLLPFFFAGEDSRETDEVAKELEHAVLQNTMDKEMHELNKRLEQKEV